MSRLWAKIIVKQRIAQQATKECAADGAEEALIEMCRDFDIPAPIWLNKHRREFESFRHTSFLPEHFIETVSFQKLEIRFLEDDDKKRKSADPRNYSGSIESLLSGMR